MTDIYASRTLNGDHFIGQYRVEYIDECSRGMGGANLYGHEPGCGIEPVAPTLPLLRRENRNA